MPIKKLDSERVTAETELWRLLAIAGKAGRYMSIDSGPIAVSRPMMIITVVLLFRNLSVISFKYNGMQGRTANTAAFGERLLKRFTLLWYIADAFFIYLYRASFL